VDGEVDLHVPEVAKAGRVGVTVDGVQVADKELGRDRQKIVTRAITPLHEVVTVTVEVDHTFSSPGDQRVLGVIVAGVGFLP
jgi:hypothetical protein